MPCLAHERLAQLPHLPTAIAHELGYSVGHINVITTLARPYLGASPSQGNKQVFTLYLALGSRPSASAVGRKEGEHGSERRFHNARISIRPELGY